MNDRTFDGSDGSAEPKRLTAAAFADLGQGQIAYVKALVTDAGTLWAIHGANGDPLAVMDSRDIALAALRQNDLEAFGVH
ncbi:MAG: DUF1150 domain-containing protein [Rhodospirillales bacterium]|jgi:hypothetical protein|nr:DUF1150 domain-containing protein [Rhodospirillales bacterium]